MKESCKIIGLPVISVDEAAKLGEIKDVLIDPDDSKIKYLLIMDRKWYLGAKLLSFDKVLSIGDDAITIRSKKDLEKFYEVEDAKRLAERDIRVIDAKAFTEEGQCMGTILEYYVREKDGSICGCLLDSPNGSRMVECPKIISFGTGTLVMEVSIKEGVTEVEDIVKEQPGNSAKLFEEKQRQFLAGRKVKRRILDETGNVLLEKGQEITDEILSGVVDKNKIIELTINSR